MSKEFFEIYPDKDYLTFHEALTRVKSCREYLIDRGMVDKDKYVIKSDECWNEYGGTKLSGILKFGDGSHIDNLPQGSDLSNLISNLVNKEFIFLRGDISENVLSYTQQKNRVFSLTMTDDKFDFYVGIRDPKLVIPFSKVRTKFKFGYGIRLKDLSMSQDNLDLFEKYKDDLTKLAINPNIFIPNGTKKFKPIYHADGTKIEEKVEVVNPWDIEVDKIESLVLGEGK